MGWAHTQDTPGSNAVASNSSATSLGCGAFGSPNTIGNFIVVFVWGNMSSSAWNATNVTCSDNATTPNTYNNLVSRSIGALPQGVGIYLAQINHLPSSGNLNPTVSLAQTGVIVCCASEFSGGSSTTDGSNTNFLSASTGTSATPAAMTTTNAGDLLLWAFTNDTSSTSATITPVSPLTNYTSVGKEVNGSSVDVGNGLYWLPGATETNINPACTINATHWACVQVALAPGAATSHISPAIYRSRRVVIGTGVYKKDNPWWPTKLTKKRRRRKLGNLLEKIGV